MDSLAVKDATRSNEVAMVVLDDPGGKTGSGHHPCHFRRDQIPSHSLIRTQA